MKVYNVFGNFFAYGPFEGLQLGKDRVTRLLRYSTFGQINMHRNSFYYG